MAAPSDFDHDAMRWPYTLLPLSSAVFAIGYVLYLSEAAPALFGLFPRSEVRLVLSQLSIALFAAYVVVVLLTRTITTAPVAEGSDTGSNSGADPQRDPDIASERDRTRGGDGTTAATGAQAAAMNQFTQALDEHLAMLCAWYVAAHGDSSPDPPASYHALLSDGFAETVRELDFSTGYDAGGSRPTTWLSWSAVRLGEFRRETMAILAVHSDRLDPAVAEQLHTLGNSRLTKRVITADEADLPTEPALLLFPDTDGDDPLAEHLDTLRDTLALHETQGSSSVTPIHEQDLWAADSDPQPGVARADPDTDDEQYYKLF
jgi:hypothetical protein